MVHHGLGWARPWEKFRIKEAKLTAKVVYYLACKILGLIPHNVQSTYTRHGNNSRFAGKDRRIMDGIRQRDEENEFGAGVLSFGRSSIEGNSKFACLTRRQDAHSNSILLVTWSNFFQGQTKATTD